MQERNKRGRPISGRTYNGYGVYKITCTANNKTYFGSSNTVYNRICNQKCRLRKGYSTCADMLRDFRHYGEGAFLFEIIAHCADRKEALSVKQGFISEHNKSGNLYNKVAALGEKKERKRKNSPRCDGGRFQITLPERQKEWVMQQSSDKKISASYFIETIVDSMMSNRGGQQWQLAQ